MVGKSDVEEIEFDEENFGDADDSASNLSEPRQLRRSSSRRKTRQDVTNDASDQLEEMKITATTSRQKKRLMDKEREEFLSEFDQTTSLRERRKKDTKQIYKESARGKVYFTHYHLSVEILPVLAPSIFTNFCLNFKTFLGSTVFFFL